MICQTPLFGFEMACKPFSGKCLDVVASFGRKEMRQSYRVFLFSALVDFGLRTQVFLSLHFPVHWGIGYLDLRFIPTSLLWLGFKGEGWAVKEGCSMFCWGHAAIHWAVYEQARQHAKKHMWQRSGLWRVKVKKVKKAKVRILGFWIWKKHLSLTQCLIQGNFSLVSPQLIPFPLPKPEIIVSQGTAGRRWVFVILRCHRFLPLPFRRWETQRTGKQFGGRNKTAA